MEQRPINKARGLRAQDAVDYYAHLVDKVLDESNLRDLLTDIMHRCDTTGVDLEHELDLARENYGAETEMEIDDRP